MTCKQAHLFACTATPKVSSAKSFVRKENGAIFINLTDEYTPLDQLKIACCCTDEISVCFSRTHGEEDEEKRKLAKQIQKQRLNLFRHP